MALFGSKVSVGVDVSGNMVKLVQLGKRGNDIVLLQLSMTKVSDEPLDKMEWETKAGLIANAIKKVVAEAKIKTKEVNTSVSGSSVVVRYIKLPYATERDLRNTIRTEAEDYIPFNIQDVALDFQILGQVKEEGEEKIKVLLVAAKNELIHQHFEILKMAKLVPVLINVDTFATEDAWSLSGEGKEDVVALVEISNTSTNINIVEHGVSCFNRDAIIGGNDFIEAIQREFNLDFRKADQVMDKMCGILLAKREEGGVPEEEEQLTEDRVSSTLERVAGKLLAELNRSFAYYYTQSHGGSIDKVVLSGGSARILNLDKFLSNGLGTQVAILNPFARVKIDPNKFNLDLINRMAPAFAVSIGLAFRGLVG